MPEKLQPEHILITKRKEKAPGRIFTVLVDSMTHGRLDFFNKGIYFPTNAAILNKDELDQLKATCIRLNIEFGSSEDVRIDDLAAYAGREINPQLHRLGLVLPHHDRYGNRTTITAVQMRDAVSVLQNQSFKLSEWIVQTKVDPALSVESILRFRDQPDGIFRDWNMLLHSVPVLRGNKNTSEQTRNNWEKYLKQLKKIAK